MTRDQPQDGALDIALIPGDGIGPEVVAAAVPVLEQAAKGVGVSLYWNELDWGGRHYREQGRFMPVDAVEVLRSCDAILLGAVGDPSLPGDPAVNEVILPIRRGLDLFANLRPIVTQPGVASPLRDPRSGQIDILFVRENTEGEYADRGHIDDEGAEQVAVFTRRGVERVARYALGAARARGGRLVSVTKSNALRYSMVLWDEVVADVARDFPDVTVTSLLVDAAAYELVRRPWDFDVVVASNLFGDILSDLGAAVQGSLGMAPSANVTDVRGVPGFFEPVHGSAPEIAGRGVANPVGTIIAGAMMFDHLGFPSAAGAIRQAVTDVLQHGAGTPDIGGTLSTVELGKRVAKAVGN